MAGTSDGKESQDEDDKSKPEADAEESKELPSADDQLARVTPEPAEPDAAQRRRLTEAGITGVEAQAKTAEAEAVLAQARAAQAKAEARKADAEVETAKIAAKQAADDRELRKDIANKVFTAALVQVVLADTGFAIYACTAGWANIHASTMHAWLGATVIQVVAVALVIARSLFPS